MSEKLKVNLYNYRNANSSDVRTEIIEAAFNLIKCQEEYIKILSDEINNMAVLVDVHDYKSELVEKGSELRKLIEFNKTITIT